MRGTALLLALLGAVASIAPAAAQSVRFAPDPPEQQVTELMARARSDLSRVTGGAGMPNESLLERNEPLLPLPEARVVIDVGFASGAARWCELDWRGNLSNLLSEERTRGTWSERQIAYIGVLHAHAMAAILDAYSGRRCSAGERALVEDFMRRRWAPAAR